MDALALDMSTPSQLLEEYEEIGKRPSKEPETSSSPAPLETPSLALDDSTGDYYSESDIANGATVPVEDSDGERSPQASAGARGRDTRSSTSSSSSSSSQSGYGPASLYQAGFLAPKISYDRDFEEQKLIAIIGREFDTPSEIASGLQRLVGVARRGENEVAMAKFVPFTVRRKVLLKGQFDGQELRKHNLICMCYNASEARIMLVGQDGYYSALLRHTESILGRNKVAFLVTHYVPPLGQPVQISADGHLLSPSLRTRLHSQEALRHYLEAGQVFSWSSTPTHAHAERLVELSRTDPDPQGIWSNVGQQCVLV